MTSDRDKSPATHVNGHGISAREATRVRSQFIAAMDAELAANEPRKGDFAAFRIPHAQARGWMEEHTAKLYSALAAHDAAGVREHCADIANIAMKIEECFGPDAGR